MVGIVSEDFGQSVFIVNSALTDMLQVLPLARPEL